MAVPRAPFLLMWSPNSQSLTYLSNAEGPGGATIRLSEILVAAATSPYKTKSESLIERGSAGLVVGRWGRRDETSCFACVATLAVVGSMQHAVIVCCGAVRVFLGLGFSLSAGWYLLFPGGGMEYANERVCHFACYVRTVFRLGARSASLVGLWWYLHTNGLGCGDII